VGRTCTAGSVPYEPRVGGRREQDGLLIDTALCGRENGAKRAGGSRQREEEGRVAELGPDAAGRRVRRPRAQLRARWWWRWFDPAADGSDGRAHCHCWTKMWAMLRPC